MSKLDLYLNDVWGKVLDYIKQNEQIEKVIVDTYYKQYTKLVDLNDSKATLVTDNEISRQIISGMVDILNESFRFITKEDNIICEIFTELEYKNIAVKQSSTYNNKPITNLDSDFDNNLNLEFTFDNFIVGSSNRECHTASLSSAYSPGNNYNPLFIYGNSGLGKTHLLHSIGNFVMKRDPSKKVYYTSGSDFVEKIVSHIQSNSIDLFKRQLYEMDVLLMDDIQFLAGKEKSHEIFFHLFNELINNKRQICITSDKHPNEIKGLEDRLISRFSSGLSVGLDSPEFETAVAILRMKVENQIPEQVVIDDDVIAYLATNFSKDVRSLEGSIRRLLFYSIQFSEKDHIDMNIAIETFKGQVDYYPNKELSITLIKKVVADYYGLTKLQLVSKSRTANIAKARQVAMYLSRKLMDVSLVKIGEEFGKRDHSTVINACNKVEENLKKDLFYQKAIQDMEAIITSK